MPRIRTIKPEFWSSPDICEMSFAARLVYIAMWNWADDDGRGTYEPRELAGFVFPRDSVTVDEFRRLVGEIHLHVGVVFYIIDRRCYYAIPSWNSHQKRDPRFKGSKYPGPEVGQAIDPVTMRPLNASTSNDGGCSGDAGGVQVGSTYMSVGDTLHVALGTGEQGNRGTGNQYLGQLCESAVSEMANGADVDTPKSKPKPKLDPALFDRFWDAYPRHVRKDRARTAFAAACKRADPETIIAGAKRLAADPNLPEKQFIPYPTTWLNGGGWDDEPLPERHPQPRQTTSLSREDIYAQLGHTPTVTAQRLDQLPTLELQ